MTLCKSWQLLLIDDDEDEFVLFSSLIENINERSIKIRWVDSLLHGQLEVQNNRYDAVFVDYDLGGHQNGLDFIHKVRLSNHSLPLILYTGRNEHTLNHQAYIVGASCYLHKASVNPELLKHILTCLIKHN